MWGERWESEIPPDPVCYLWDGGLGSEYLLSARHRVDPHQMVNFLFLGQDAAEPGSRKPKATWGSCLRDLGWVVW